MGEKRPKEPDPPLHFPTEDKGEKIDKEMLEFMRTPSDEKPLYLFKMIRVYRNRLRDDVLNWVEGLNNQDRQINARIANIKNGIRDRIDTLDKKMAFLYEGVSNSLNNINSAITNINNDIASINSDIYALQLTSHPPYYCG